MTINAQIAKLSIIVFLPNLMAAQESPTGQMI